MRCICGRQTTDSLTWDDFKALNARSTTVPPFDSFMKSRTQDKKLPPKKSFIKRIIEKQKRRTTSDQGVGQYNDYFQDDYGLKRNRSSSVYRHEKVPHMKWKSFHDKFGAHTSKSY